MIETLASLLDSIDAKQVDAATLARIKRENNVEDKKLGIENAKGAKQMASKDIHTSVFTRLSNLTSNDDAAKLFASILNYEYNGKTLSTNRFPSSLDGRIKQVQLLAGHDGFKVMHCEVDKLQLGIERPIINNLLKDHPYSLFLFSDSTKGAWHFVNEKHDEER